MTAPAQHDTDGTAGIAPGTTLAKALNRALHDEMSHDDRVVVFGEDVGRLGGVFRVTDGLAARFGEQRCFDTPVAESAILGMAIGMAMYGLRPVVEMQFDAFAYPAFEQLASHLAKMRNRTRGAVSLPVVVRVPYGGGIGGVEHHSDSSEAYAAHTPGLHVLTPGTVEDAYGMLRAAVRGADPVVFFEPKRLYWSVADVALPTEVEPVGRAVIRRAGTHATLVAYGPTVPIALAAAELGAAEGYDLEVIDLRSLVPFDEQTVHESVRRTGRAIVVHEASGFAGFGAEVVARICEECFHHLEAPVRRVTGFDIPYPPPRLERFHLPSVDRVLDAVSSLWRDQ
ncbi:alpha-ketoacid dehydrogenase subunit beta [Micromonospora sp. NPDC005215]|uniref:alpha-ketoacid dehydrogenase subunit beta n=1 Tax=Micromonospora sp. NPDC005215 TaxID=3157024 RepID=UPI0033A3979B